MDSSNGIAVRAARHAALGDPIRLAIIDELAVSDRAPVELRQMLGLESNLLAHHLDVLESNELITRRRSSGDGRRRYVHLERSALEHLAPGRRTAVGPAVFVCTRNSARSQLAAALWMKLTGQVGASAGTDPADRVHPGAIASARRIGLDLGGARPRRLDDIGALPSLVVTVCDRAHEDLAPEPTWLHWSIPDPVPTGTNDAFDAARDDLHARITALAGRAT